ncbi:MAG: sulfite exporter TauE/SafE family protein [Mycobacteriales bacterium]
MTPGTALLVAGAGFVAGGVNAVAGGGTLVSFPALLAAGVPPVLANTTSSVGLLAGYAGGSVAYRRELAGQGLRARRLLLAAVAGGVLGAVLLLALPGDSFRAVVPYLVLLACLLLALQPRLVAALAARGTAGPHPGWEAQVAVGIAAVYGSYFGAGLGVVLLAVLGVLVADDLQRLNALKGLLSLVVNLVGALLFVVTGHVDWAAAALLAAGAALGATVGVGLARRLPPAWVRTAVVVGGVAVAVSLLVA